MPYIVSSTFQVEAVKEGVLNRFSGLAVRSLLYNKILGLIMNPEDVHKYRGLKPVSVSPIYTIQGDRYRILGKGHRLKYGLFRVNFLSVEDCYEVVDKLASSRDLLIDGIPIKVLDINIAITSYDRIIEQARHIDEFVISFRSPTMLRSPGYYVKMAKVEGGYRPIVKQKRRKTVVYLPFPHPTLIFKNIVRQFRKFSGSNKFPYNEVLEFIENDGVILKGYPSGIRTRAIRVSMKEHYVGFVGKAIFQVNERNDWAKYIAPLLRYAEFSNIGAARTGGFGWVRTEVAEV